MNKTRLLAVMIAIGMAAGVAGCNTVKGAGKDIQGAGKAVENTADDVHKDIKKN